MTTNKYQIPSYPTLVFFSPKDKSDYEVYEGSRSLQGIVEAAREKNTDYTVEFTIPQIINEEILTSACDKKKTLCVIALLEDETLLPLLKPAMKKFATRRMEFLWAESGDHPDLEKSFRAK